MPGALVRKGDRVSLRTAEDEDQPFLQRGYAEPEIRRPMGNPVRSRTDLEAADSDGSGDRFVVCIDGADVPASPPDEGDVRRIGFVAVTDADWRRPELGYWLVPEVHGDGYGTEAVALAVDYAFGTYAHPAVEAKTYDFNEASRALLESLGFEEEGRLRERRFIHGRYVDTVFYGLLREDWDGVPAP